MRLLLSGNDTGHCLRALSGHCQGTVRALSKQARACVHACFRARVLLHIQLGALAMPHTSLGERSAKCSPWFSLGAHSSPYPDKDISNAPHQPRRKEWQILTMVLAGSSLFLSLLLFLLVIQMSVPVAVEVSGSALPSVSLSLSLVLLLRVSIQHVRH